MAFEFLWIFLSHQIQTFIMDSAHSSKTRVDQVHPDFTSRSRQSLVWSITEHPMRQSRMCFSSSCPKPSLFLKAAGIIKTLLYLCTYPTPNCPQHQFGDGCLRPKGTHPTWEPKTRRGCDSRDREHTLDSGVTLTCSPFIFEGFFSFVLWFIFFFIKPQCKHCFGCQHERRDTHSRTRGNYVINTIQTNAKEN